LAAAKPFKFCFLKKKSVRSGDSRLGAGGAAAGA
jgi:hypothetical protein